MDARGRHYIARVFVGSGHEILRSHGNGLAANLGAIALQTGSTLPAVGYPLVGDVAYVVGIEALRSTPLIVDGSAKAKPALVRTLMLDEICSAR